MRLFGSSGIRRVVGRDLVEIALRVGLAVGRPGKRVVIGRDTRTSGRAVELALTSGLLAMGAEVTDAGIVPTPTLAIAAREADCGIMITASHNPPQYNGLKLFNPDGSSYFESQQVDLERALSGPLTTSNWEEMHGVVHPLSNAIPYHIERIKQHVRVDKKVRVVVDCACGAASVITPYLLREMGFDVIALNSHPSGFFPHDIEPTDQNLTDLKRVCGELGAVGVAHDGDADRMMGVDELGRFISGDTALILLAREVGARSVVTTVDASMAVEDSGFQVRRTKVGDSFVSEELSRGGEFGGEPSGAWVFPKSSLCPDGILAAATFAAMASRSKISQMVDEIPRYPVVRGSIEIDPGAKLDAGTLRDQLGAGEVDETDGVKLKFKDAWVLIRPSGTEPKMRITVEARTQDRAQRLYEQAAGVVAAVHAQRSRSA